MTPHVVPHGIDLQPLLVAAPAVPGADRWRVHVYAHTHWDREWYRSFERFRMQLVGMVDRVLHVLDSDPRFATFVLDGQTIVLEDYLAIRPEEEPRIRRLVGAGRLEVGPWHVLPDEFLVSGESMVRNLLEGRRIASRFGTPLAVGYLPDPFGHVAQLPAILRGFGIDNVIFSRGMGDEHARLGNEFRWESPAGIDVLALVQGSPYTSGYCNAELVGRGNDAADPEGYERIADLVPYLIDRARTDALLLAAGCDHETIQPQLPDVVEQLGELLPGATVAITGLDGYVASVRDAERRLEAGGAALERHRGELRGSLHAPILSSIFSARVSLKQDNDRVQALLEQHVEPLMATAVIAGVRPRRDVDPFLRHAWRLVLENHPHDSIGGCSIDEVHLEMPSRTMRAEATALGLVEDLRTALQLGDVAVVHDAVGRGGIAERRDGTPLEVVAGRPGMLVPLSDVQPGEREGRAEIEGDSGIRAGTLAARVVDGRLQVERDGSRTWLDYVDEADAGDEYDFGQVPGDEPIIATVTQVQACMASAGVAELDVLHELQLPIALAEGRAARSDELASTTIRTRVRLALTSELAQLVVELDNQVDDHRLRLRATVDALSATDRVTALGHFALIERPVRPAQPQQPWRQQPPGLDHCAGAVRAGEVLLAGRGIHEYEAGVGRLELTLLRAVGWLSRDDIAARPGHAGPALAAPGAQCRGPIRLDLAVGIGGDRDAAFDEARSFLVPPLLLEPFGIGESQQPRAVAGPVVPLESGSMARARDVLEDAPRDARARIDAIGIRLEGAGVVPSACKLADDGSGDLIARWWAPDNATGARAELHVAAAVRDVHRARLDETRLGPAPFERGVCSIGVQPGGISTLRVSFEE